MERYETIVIGLGAMGSAAAFHLARRGKRVLGLEQFGLAHDRGSSHGRSRITRQAYFEHPAYVPLLNRATDLWSELRHEDRPVLRITGGLMFGPPDGPVVKGALASARMHKLPHEVLDAAEVRRRFPSFTVEDPVIGVLESRAGVLFPEDCIRAHIAGARSAGAEARFEEPITRWKATKDSVEVTTPWGSYVADSLVLCAGAWMSELLADLNMPLTVERNVLYWFRPTTDLKLFAPGELPIFILEHEPGKVFYGIPAIGEDGVKVARHHTGENCTPTTVRREVTSEDVRDIRSILERCMPTVNGELLSATTCLYTNTPDGHFILDRHPEHLNVFLASPCSGHGFKFASVIGEVLSDLVCDGRTQHPIEMFQLQRFRAR